MSFKQTLRPFHLAFPIKNIKESELWYSNILGCTIGRQTKQWIDFNFFGHQIVGHVVKNIEDAQVNEVDKNSIPSRHFGIILKPAEWKSLARDLKSKNVEFQIQPHTRFKNKAGEQHTMFIKGPSGNYLEFKAFNNDKDIFEKSI